MEVRGEGGSSVGLVWFGLVWFLARDITSDHGLSCEFGWFSSFRVHTYPIFFMEHSVIHICPPICLRNGRQESDVPPSIGEEEMQTLRFYFILYL
jgi:hypothetical protein